jgi:hypothetical protein
MFPNQVLSPAFFNFCQHTWIATWIQGSTWGFAIIETIHIIALTVLLGTMTIVDLRALGFALSNQALAKVARQVMPSFWTALVIAASTGTALYLSEAVRLSHSKPFFWKMLLVIIALLLHMTVYPRTINLGRREGSTAVKAVAGASLALWLGVALAGRLIAFLTN